MRLSSCFKGNSFLRKRRLYWLQPLWTCLIALSILTILPSAARNAPSMAWTAIFTASLVYMSHTCCKFGNLCPTWRIFGSAIMTTQLDAFPAAPSASTKAIKELQVSRAKIKATCIIGSFIFRMSLALNRLEPWKKTGTHFCIPAFPCNSANWKTTSVQIGHIHFSTHAYAEQYRQQCSRWKQW